MESIKPDALRTADGTEYYTTQLESYNSFAPPSEDEKFLRDIAVLSAFEQRRIIAHRSDAQNRAVTYERRVHFPWIRSSENN